MTSLAAPIFGRTDLVSDPARAKVSVRWLGTAGFALEAEGTTILIDPYFTRASIASVVTRRLAPDLELCAKHAPRADAILLGHTHFDHALDAPAIARVTGARVFGSRSAVALCRASGVAADRVEMVERDPGSPPIVREVGPFKLRFIPSAHSRLLLGRVPFPGDIADCDDIPMRAERYRCGAVFSVDIEVCGKSIVHLGSAEVVGDRLRRETDLLLLCVAGWTSSHRLPERAASAFSPRAVVLSHWDDFFSPLDRPVRALPAMQADRLCERLGRVTRDARIGALPLLGDLLL